MKPTNILLVSFHSVQEPKEATNHINMCDEIDKRNDISK